MGCLKLSVPSPPSQPEKCSVADEGSMGRGITEGNPEWDKMAPGPIQQGLGTVFLSPTESRDHVSFLLIMFSVFLI